MSSTKTLDPRILEILRRKRVADPNNGKAAAEAKYASITPDPNRPAHSEEFNRGMPGGGAEPSAVQPDDLLVVGSAAKHGGELAFNLATRAGAAKEAFSHAPQLAKYFRNASALGGERGAAAGRLADGVIADNPLGSRLKAAANAFVDRAPQPMAKDLKLQQLGKTMHADMKSPAAQAFNTKVAEANTPAHVFDDATVAAPGKTPTLPAPTPNAAAQSFPPGQAPHPDGLSPTGVVKAQMQMLNDYKPKQKLATGGPVKDPRVAKHLMDKAGKTPMIPDSWWNAPHGVKPVSPEGAKIMEQEHIAPEELYHNEDPVFKGDAEYAAHGGIVAPHHIYHAAANAVHAHCFAVGGVVPDEPTKPVAGEPLPPIVPPAALASAPAPAAPAPAPTAPTPLSAHPVAAEGDAAVKANDDPLAKLQAIEDQRSASLKEAEPGVASRIGRVLSSGLLGFAGKAPIDFAAGDRANRKEINDKADKSRKEYLSAPSELAARNSSVAGSTESIQMRGLVGKIIGDSSLTQNMSASELKGAGPFIQEYLKAKQAGNTLAMQQAVAALKHSVEVAHVNIDAGKLKVSQAQLPINQQNADANMIRANKSSNKEQSTMDRATLAAYASTKAAPDYAQALNNESYIRAIQPFLDQKEPLTARAIKLMISNIAKIEGGGVASQHVIDELTSPTVQGRLSDAIEHLTGNPGDAGYGEIVRKFIKPYVQKLAEAQKQTKKAHADRVIGAYEGSASPEVIQRIRKLEETNAATPASKEEQNPDADIGGVPE